MWWKLSKNLLLALTLLKILFSSQSQAASLAFSRNARTFETIQSSLFIKGMAHSCLTVFEIPDGMPCNPANIPKQKKPRLGMEALLSNGSNNLGNVRKLLKGKITQELVDTLFNEGKIIQIEANSEINFQSNIFNARYTPLTVKGFSVVRNEANPEVEVSVIEESGLMLQSGYGISKNFLIGAQVRFVDRKFIRQQVRLTALGTAAGKDLLKPKKQAATYFEPGMTWIIADKWQPRVSLLLANLGTVSEDYDELEIPVELQAGIGLSPPLTWGNMDLSIDYKSLSYTEDSLNKLRYGMAYRFGAMNIATGIDANGISAGIFYGLDFINAGISYSSTKVLNGDEEFFTQTVYVQLGWRI